MELDADNVTEEHDKLCQELASVEASLKRLRDQNSKLTRQISVETSEVAEQQVQIRSHESDMDKIGNHVSQFFLLQDLSFSYICFVYFAAQRFDSRE